MISKQRSSTISCTNTFILSYPCRLEAEARIVPHAGCSRPLQQIVYGRVTTAIVEVLRIEGTRHGTLGQIDHRHLPVLSAVGRVVLLGHDASVVLATVAIAKRHPGLSEGMNAIGSIGIEAILHRLVDAEGSCILRAGLCYRDEREHTIAFTAHRHLRSIGRNEDYCTTHLAFEGLHLPQLSLVRTIILTHAHLVAVGTQSLVGEGVDNAHTTREVRHGPILSGISLINGLKLEHGTIEFQRQSAVCCRVHTIQSSLTEGRLGHQGTHDKKHCRHHHRADAQNFSFLHIFQYI